MSNLAMPKIDRKLMARKKEVVADLKKIIKAENIIDHDDEQIKKIDEKVISKETEIMKIWI